MNTTFSISITFAKNAPSIFPSARLVIKINAFPVSHKPILKTIIVSFVILLLKDANNAVGNKGLSTALSASINIMWILMEDVLYALPSISTAEHAPSSINASLAKMISLQMEDPVSPVSSNIKIAETAIKQSAQNVTQVSTSKMAIVNCVIPQIQPVSNVHQLLTALNASLPNILIVDFVFPVPNLTKNVKNAQLSTFALTASMKPTLLSLQSANNVIASTKDALFAIKIDIH